MTSCTETSRGTALSVISRLQTSGVARCYSSLDEAEKCLEYTRKSVEVGRCARERRPLSAIGQVKKANGVQPTWFDIWDLGKAHARLGGVPQEPFRQFGMEVRRLSNGKR